MKQPLHINEFRKQLSFKIDRGVSILIYLKHFVDRDYTIDFDVFLPTKNKNLQRDFVWTLWQKQELIISLLKGIKIPSISVILKDQKHFQIIDGKQRLSAMIGYLKGEFPIAWKGEEYYFDDLGSSTQGEIRFYTVIGDLAYEDTGYDEIAWFEMINFAGTPQDIEHLNNLKS